MTHGIPKRVDGRQELLRRLPYHRTRRPPRPRRPFTRAAGTNGRATTTPRLRRLEPGRPVPPAIRDAGAGVGTGVGAEPTAATVLSRCSDSSGWLWASAHCSATGVEMRAGIEPVLVTDGNARAAARVASSTGISNDRAEIRP